MPTRKTAFGSRVPEFLNVDLELESRRSLDPLVMALGRRVMVLSQERRRSYYFLACELSGVTKGLNATIRALVKLVQKLPDPARALWNGARRRDLDIGIDVGAGRHVPVVTISQDTVALVSEIAARIRVTCYPTIRPTPKRPIPYLQLE